MVTKDEALKMAIVWLDNEDVINACKKALEQPAQEPVAWTSTKALENAKRLKTADLWVEYDEEYDNQAKEMGWNSKQIPLYTHPHQWQGLTDDEIEKVFESIETSTTHRKIYRAIEAKLKEKNKC